MVLIYRDYSCQAGAFVSEFCCPWLSSVFKLSLMDSIFGVIYAVEFSDIQLFFPQILNVAPSSSLSIFRDSFTFSINKLKVSICSLWKNNHLYQIYYSNIIKPSASSWSTLVRHYTREGHSKTLTIGGKFPHSRCLLHQWGIAPLKIMKTMISQKEFHFSVSKGCRETRNVDKICQLS